MSGTFLLGHSVYIYTHTHTYLYLGATIANVKAATFRETEVESFAKHLILKIKLRHMIDGYSHVP